VVEEYARFILNSPAWTSSVKDMRHRLFAVVDWMGLTTELPSWRDTPGDVGTALTSEGETSRRDLRHALSANFRRAAEGLRVLEEYSKLLEPRSASDFRRMRYELYTLEKNMMLGFVPHERLKSARLYVLVTTGLCAGRYPEDVARLAIRGGADMIQMREKDMPDGEFLRLARLMREACREEGALFIVNDRVHIAQIVDADGVHVGQDDLPAADARKLLGNDKIIGVSTHSPEQAAEAIRAGASYIGVGPVYATQTKTTTPAVGLEYVEHAAEHVCIPFFAIGGVNASTAQAILRAGARNLSVCSAVISAEDVTAAAAVIKGSIQDHSEED